MFIKIKYFLLYPLLLAACFNAWSDETKNITEILSNTKVIITDGDTIKFNNKKIRLHGIDTPEIKQLCKNKNGEADHNFANGRTTYIAGTFQRDKSST